jgi:hypothetical protein
MGDELPRIEFLDSPDDPAEIAWLDPDGEDEVYLGGSRGSSLSAPRTTARRVYGPLLIFALALSGTGFAGVHAFRHDRAVQAAGNELVLREAKAGDAVTLTDSGADGGLRAWRVDPSASIDIGVTNESPDPITLLPGATLLGSGLTAAATLRPDGATVLRPGQTGKLTGAISVNCGIQTGSLTSVLQSNTVLVQARTASGATGVATVDLGAGGASVRTQICDDEGEALTTSFFPESVDAAKHTFAIGLSARSLAAQSLHYQVTESYSSSVSSVDNLTSTEARAPWITNELTMSSSTTPSDLPGVTLSAPAPVGAVDGTLAAGASVSAGFSIRVSSCPSSLPTGQAAVELTVLLDDDGTAAVSQTYGFSLSTLVSVACGLIA